MHLEVLGAHFPNLFSLGVDCDVVAATERERGEGEGEREREREG